MRRSCTCLFSTSACVPICGPKHYPLLIRSRLRWGKTWSGKSISIPLEFLFDIHKNTQNYLEGSPPESKWGTTLCASLSLTEGYVRELRLRLTLKSPVSRTTYRVGGCLWVPPPPQEGAFSCIQATPTADHHLSARGWIVNTVALALTHKHTHTHTLVAIAQLHVQLQWPSVCRPAERWSPKWDSPFFISAAIFRPFFGHFPSSFPPSQDFCSTPVPIP